MTDHPQGHAPAPGVAGAADGELGWFEVGGPGPAELRSDPVVITFHGELDESNVERLWTALEVAVGELAGTGEAACSSVVVVDLAAVRFMGSAGLRLLLRLRTGLASSGRRLVIRAPAGTAARRILQIAGLQSELDVWPDLEGPDAAVAD